MPITIDLEGKQVVICPKCGGSGMSKAYPEDQCWTCHGGGHIVVESPARNCFTCKGTGMSYGHTCASCRGCGYKGRHESHLAIDKDGNVMTGIRSI